MARQIARQINANLPTAEELADKPRDERTPFGPAETGVIDK